MVVNYAARSGDLGRLGLSIFSSHCCSRGEGFRLSFSFSTKWEKAGFGLPLPRVTSSMGGPTPGTLPKFAAASDKIPSTAQSHVKPSARREQVGQKSSVFRPRRRNFERFARAQSWRPGGISRRIAHGAFE